MRFRKKISFSGILAGSFLYMAGVIMLGLLLGTALTIGYIFSQGVELSPDELTTNVMKIFETNPLILTISFFWIAIIAIFSGYVTAYIAKHNELLNGGLCGVLSILLTILLNVLTASAGTQAGYYYGADSAPFWILSNLTIFALPLFTLFGGFLRSKQKSRKRARQPGAAPLAEMPALEPQPNYPSTELMPSEQAPASAATETPATPPPAARNKAAWVAASIIGVLLVCMCCACLSVTAAAGGLFIVGVTEIDSEQQKAEVVIDAYLNAMADRSAQRAYELYSTRAKNNLSESDIEDLLEGDNYRQYFSYRSLEITEFRIEPRYNANPNQPSGTIAEVTGTITYDGGYVGVVTATLVQEGEAWRIFSIEVTPRMLGTLIP